MVPLPIARMLVGGGPNLSMQCGRGGKRRTADPEPTSLPVDGIRRPARPTRRREGLAVSWTRPCRTSAYGALYGGVRST